MHRIRHTLGRTGRRLRVVRALRIFVEAVSPPLCALSLAALPDKLGLGVPWAVDWTGSGLFRDGGPAWPQLVFPAPYGALFILLPGLALVYALLRAALARPSPLAIALRLDHALGLKERLTSAVAFAADAPPPDRRRPTECSAALRRRRRRRRRARLRQRAPLSDLPPRAAAGDAAARACGAGADVRGLRRAARMRLAGTARRGESRHRPP